MVAEDPGVLGRPGGPVFMPQPGPQTRVLVAPQREILLGGAKAGGKSYAGRMWLMKGNPEYYDKPRSPSDLSYTLHPHYRALVLRRNVKDLKDWVMRADAMYRPYGAEWHPSDNEFVWPNGARIMVDHLADASAFFSYEGNEIHRLLVEELTHIPTYRLYSEVKKNVRTEYPELFPQILCTTNPPGPGASWVKARFIDPEPPNTEIREEVIDPISGKLVTHTRIFIPAKLTDNLILQKSDPTYGARLMADLETDAQRRAYIHGDWSAMAGTYFTDYRDNGPLGDEPPEARHVADVPLMSWWPRLLSIDVGFRHHTVVLKSAIHPNGQLIVYDEMVEAGVGNEEWGARIAQWCWKELQELPSHVITMWTSPDAFHRRGDPKSRAEQIAAGVDSILGPQASAVMEVGANGKDFLQQLAVQDSARIAIRPASDKRVAGWQYLHGMMRFRPIAPASKSMFNPQYAQQLLEEEGATRYTEYLAVFRERAPEVLPKLIINPRCKGFRKAIPTAAYPADPDAPNPEDIVKLAVIGDDFLDAGRYLTMGFKHIVEQEPPEVFVDKRVQQALAQNPYLDADAVFQIRQRGYQDYPDVHAGALGFNVGRIAGARAGVRLM